MLERQRRRHLSELFANTLFFDRCPSAAGTEGAAVEILAVSLALLLPTTQTGASPKKDFFFYMRPNCKL